MKHFRMVVLAGLFVLALLFPLLFPNASVVTVAVFTLIFALAATGWNIFSGYTGYFSLGHMTFYGLGAYSITILCQKWHVQGGYLPFLLLPLAGVIAGVWAMFFGWFALGSRRHVFVIISLASVLVFQLLAYNLPAITSGSQGLYLPTPAWSGDEFNLPYYYVALALVAFALYVSWRVRRSKFGLGLLAIRDDEDRARSLGVKIGAYKMTAYAISAFFVGMAGALYAYYAEFITPGAVFAPVNDVTIALMALTGGLGSVFGATVGAILIEPLQQYLTFSSGTNGLDLVLYGVLYLVVILFLPSGIIPSLRARWSTQRLNRLREQERSVKVSSP